MEFNSTEEKLRVYDLLSLASVDNSHYKKKQALKQAISFANSEFEELAQSYHDFFKSIDHLVIFRETMKDQVIKDTLNMMKDLQVLISKEYKKEELEAMPTTVYNQVLSSQKQRAQLLKVVAETYFSPSIKK